MSDKKGDNLFKKLGKGYVAAAIALSIAGGIAGYDNVPFLEEKLSSKHVYTQESRDSLVEKFSDDIIVTERENYFQNESELDETHQYIPIEQKNYIRDDIETVFPHLDGKELETFYESVSNTYDNIKDHGLEVAAQDALSFIDEIDDLSKQYDVPLKIPLGTWLIESGGDLNSISTTGYHIGPMQQSPHFANSNGVVINNHRDERMHPIKAVEGALKNYSNIYENQYGRWDFTIMEYISGRGNVDSLITDYIEKHTGNNYTNSQVSPELLDKYDVSLAKIKQDEELFYSHVNKNNSIGANNYVEKVIAANNVIRNYLKENGEIETRNIETYEAKSGDSLAKIANAKNVELDDIQYYNHWIKTLMPGDEVLIPTNKGSFKYSDFEDYF